MPKRILLSLIIFLGLFSLYYFWKLPESKLIEIQAPPLQKQALLVPLDSRPVCTRLPQRLAALAGVNLILPPNEFLDNYRSPAKTEKILQWLPGQLEKVDTAYMSTDMLLAGGLIQSRKQASTEAQQKALVKQLETLKAKHKRLELFQIIPRLLVSDELIPDRWYKYRLLRYAQLFDMVEEFNDFELTKQLLEVEGKIPPRILAKYKLLYQAQDQLNQRLVALVEPGTSLVIGQDDGEAFGLPNRSARFIENHITKTKAPSTKAQLSYGADELAAMLIARSYLSNISYSPKVYIQYADSSIPNLIMPYLPVSVAGVLKEKLSLLNAQQVSAKEQADFILYVNCGNDGYRPSKKQAQELQQLLDSSKHIALIDLTANFEENELLLPQALESKVSLNRLSAYAGWNTFSNSAGSVLAQAAIFTGRLKTAKTEAERLQIYTANFSFNLERLLDDYCYQKKLHATLKKKLLTRGIEPTELNAHDHSYAQALAQFFLQNQGLLLLHKNLGRTPYYETENGQYYLKALDIKARLPWKRIFEIDLQPQPTFGIRRSNS